MLWTAELPAPLEASINDEMGFKAELEAPRSGWPKHIPPLLYMSSKTINQEGVGL